MTGDIIRLTVIQFRPWPPLFFMHFSILDTIAPTYYRLGTFFVMSILDDPAMLAFAFS